MIVILVVLDCNFNLILNLLLLSLVQFRNIKLKGLKRVQVYFTFATEELVNILFSSPIIDIKS